MSVTTIKLRTETKALLDEYRQHPAESYDQVVRKLVSVVKVARRDPPLSQKTLKDIEEARKQSAAGKFYTEEEVWKLLGVNRARRRV
jgi:predicted transcriptional regulator